MIAVGLMSGTSLDGIDAALVRIVPQGTRYSLELLEFVTLPFDDELAALVRAVVPPSVPGPALVADVHRRMGFALARAARNASGGARVDYVASHGLTLYHDGPHHLTTQIGDPFVLREALHASVCYDFRSADCAAGGHGAPLVPYVDALLVASDDEDRIALNVGGIANLTALPRGASKNDVVAFDTGPGVMLVDAFVRERSRGEAAMDIDGAIAAAGVKNDLLLEDMLSDPYFSAAPPKSTGRERFGAQFLEQHGERLERLSVEDGLATLTELTAVTIANAVEAVELADAHIFCSGGGARNLFLMRRLAARLPKARIEPSDAVGLPIDAKEAIAFAVLGYETLRERASNVPRVTGASRAVGLGSIAPWRLRELLAEVDVECQSS
jgi:anhydro-N-acetylmuramic acid kinase